MNFGTPARSEDTAALAHSGALLPASPEGRPFQARTAFLLNANARAVSPRLAERLREVVPAGDLFFSRSFDEAEAYLSTILRRGYGRLFIGGGDGTLVGVMNGLERLCPELGVTAPQLGMLKLGTGNAISYVVNAENPIDDAAHIVRNGEADVIAVDMIRCDDGTLTPFAGVGYDGEVLNDYIAVKQAAKGTLAKHLVESVWGYLGAMLTRSVPRQLRQAAPEVRITSTRDAFRMVPGPNGDEEICIPAGTVIYEGPAPTVSVGSIPYYGYGFQMFPFARRRAGYFQVRVCAVPIPTILANLFPSIWRGEFRHAKLHDFLVQDMTVEGSRNLPYQVGGDAKGYARRLTFRISDQPVEMLALGQRARAKRRSDVGALPTPSPKKA